MQRAEMNREHVRIDRQTWLRFLHMVKNFGASEVGTKAATRFAALIVLLFGINGLNIVNSYVGRDFMTALADRDTRGFVHMAVLYIGVFVASTVVAVIYRYIEERLGLLWRQWLTQRAVNTYLEHHTYYRLNDHLIANGEVANPDQRIAEDVRTLTVTTLSFVLMVLNGTFTILAFAGVLWSISPLLFLVAVLYAAGGSVLTIVLGRPLVWLNYHQLDTEANFRSSLIHVGEHAEKIALARCEGQLKARLRRQLDVLVDNMQRIIAVNRNLGFFTTGYNYLIQILPVLVVAPLFFRGEVAFGVITQSAMAFSMLLGAFSLIVTQFQAISSYAAAIARLSSLEEAIECAQSAAVSASEVCEHHYRRSECPRCLEKPLPIAAIPVDEADTCIRYERLTLLSPQDGHALVTELSVSIDVGTRLLVTASDKMAAVALFRATAGMWNTGEGHIIRPGAGQLLFLPERPYLPPGTLREALTQRGQADKIADEQILTALRALDLERLVSRTQGLDTEHDWDDILSLDEQQLLAFTHILLVAPRFVCLDHTGNILSREQFRQVLTLLSEHAITYVTFGTCEDNGDPADDYDALLTIDDMGGWQWKTLHEEPVTDAARP
jgi:putative ATP-binding cassette transporter